MNRESNRDLEETGGIQDSGSTIQDEGYWISDQGLRIRRAVQEPGATPQVRGTPRPGEDFTPDVRGVEPRDRQPEAAGSRQAHSPREAEGEADRREAEHCRQTQDGEAQHKTPMSAVWIAAPVLLLLCTGRILTFWRLPPTTLMAR